MYTKAHGNIRREGEKHQPIVLGIDWDAVVIVLLFGALFAFSGFGHI